MPTEVSRPVMQSGQGTGFSYAEKFMQRTAATTYDRVAAAAPPTAESGVGLADRRRTANSVVTHQHPYARSTNAIPSTSSYVAAVPVSQAVATTEMDALPSSSMFVPAAPPLRTTKSYDDNTEGFSRAPSRQADIPSKMLASGNLPPSRIPLFRHRSAGSEATTEDIKPSNLYTDAPRTTVGYDRAMSSATARITDSVGRMQQRAATTAGVSRTGDVLPVRSEAKHPASRSEQIAETAEYPPSGRSSRALVNGPALGDRPPLPNDPCTSAGFVTTHTLAQSPVYSDSRSSYLASNAVAVSRDAKPRERSRDSRLPDTTSSAPAPTALRRRDSQPSDNSRGSSVHSTSGRHLRAPRGLVGLVNLGNTCFMNSCLQCLSNVPQLTEYFLSGGYRSDLNRRSPTKGETALAYADLITRMWNGSSGCERPDKVKRIVGMVASRFLGYDQQDVQEFLRFFLDALHDDTNRVTVKPPYVELDDDHRKTDQAASDVWWDNYVHRNSSRCSELFAGQLKTQVRCNVCGHVSRAFDPMWDLSVPIPKGAQARDRFSDAPCSLQECLAAFTASETLTGHDALYCSRCKKHQPGEKTLQIFRLPEVMVLQLKRFTFSSFRRTKITTSVNFPVKGLDMSPFCADSSPYVQNALYDCVGVSNHSGSLGGGHYTA